MIIDEENDQFYFSGKYNIQNNSGKTYENAQLTLLMGQDNYHRDFKNHNGNYQNSSTTGIALVSKLFSSSRRDSFDDYYSQTNSDTNSNSNNIINTNTQKKKNADSSSKYTDKFPGVSKDLKFQLPTTINLPSDKVVQFNFAHGIIHPINQHYLITFAAYKHHSKSGLLDKDKDVNSSLTGHTKALLEFPNNEENNLGFPLPHGNLVVYLRNHSTNSLNDGNNDLCATTQISKSIVPTSDVGELVQICLGNTHKTFHISGSKERISFQKNDAKRTIVESFKITITNTTPDSPIIIVEDCLARWSSWSILDSSVDHHFNGADKIRWAISDLLPGGKSEITYSVQYAW